MISNEGLVLPSDRFGIFFLTGLPEMPMRDLLIDFFYWNLSRGLLPPSSEEEPRVSAAQWEASPRAPPNLLPGPSGLLPGSSRAPPRLLPGSPQEAEPRASEVQTPR